MAISTNLCISRILYFMMIYAQRFITHSVTVIIGDVLYEYNQLHGYLNILGMKSSKISAKNLGSNSELAAILRETEWIPLASGLSNPARRSPLPEFLVRSSGLNVVFECKC